MSTLEKAWRVISEPFTSTESFLQAITGLYEAVADGMSKTAWIYLLSALVIAVAIYLVRRRWGKEQRSLLGFLFPASVFKHPSALVDYRFVAVDLTFKAFVYVPLVGLLTFGVYKATVGALDLTTLRGCLDGHETVLLVAAPIFGLLLTDFCLFFAHWLMHKFAVLWDFHAVHHSAEVLTPVTVYRVHPVEEIVNGVVASLGAGVAAGLYSSFQTHAFSVPTVMGVGVGTWLFFTFAFNLRHSHIWLSYGPVLSRIFISPAQHQLHHSAENRHHDKNFGFIFAFWDLLFGTLYVPKEQEEFRLGVHGEDPRDFDSVGKLYGLPFVKAYRRIFPARKPTEQEPSPADLAPALTQSTAKES